MKKVFLHKEGTTTKSIGRQLIDDVTVLDEENFWGFLVTDKDMEF